MAETDSGSGKPEEKKPEDKSEAGKPQGASSDRIYQEVMSTKGRLLAYLLILVGVALVLLARGCDSIGARGAAAAKAEASLAKLDFDDEWDEKIAELDEGKDQEISKLRTEQEKERRKLVRGEWRELNTAASRTKYANMVSGWWHECFFILGTILLTMGLIWMAVAGTGTERWLSLLGVGIILFSLYIGGIAWVHSITSVIGR